MGASIAASNSVSTKLQARTSPLPTHKPIITIIAALAQQNRVIGHQGKLPWHLPEDLQRFKQLTWGHPIIMGRKTWEFCLGKRILPHRHSIVISRTLSSTHEPHTESGSVSPVSKEPDTSFQVVRSLPEAITSAHTRLGNGSPSKQNIFIIGGASIYAQALDMAHRLELTLIDGAFMGDAFFPPYEPLLPNFNQVGIIKNGQKTPSHTYITYEHKALSSEPTQITND